MKRNVGFYDRVVRLVLSIGLFIVADSHVVPGDWNIITWCVAGILLLTSVAGVCPLYSAFGADTRKQKKPGDSYE